MGKEKNNKNSYDIIVIGAGSGGLTAALSLANSRRVLLVEADKPGGECTHTGCIPSKALIHAANTGMSGSEALQYVRDTVAKVYTGETPTVLKEHGVAYVAGVAKFISKCTLEINGEEYNYKQAIVATGSSPRTFPIEGLEENDTLTNQNLFEQTDVPEKLLILGTGPIGMEMSQAFAQLASQVTMASIDTRLAQNEDEAVTPYIEAEMKKLGVNIELNAYIEKVENNVAFFAIKDYSKNEEGEIIKKIEVPFTKILIAVGRVPNLPEGLNLAEVKHNKKGITVNSHHKTSNKYVYAIGDVADKFKFTHQANQAGRHVAKRILSRGWLHGKDKKALPKVTYTKSEIATVGLSHQQAIEQYKADEVVRTETSYQSNDRAKTDSATEGLVIVISRRLTGKVLGATIVGKNAGEILASYTLAIDHNISMWKLSSSIYPYPTLSAIVKKNADQFVMQTLGNFKSEVAYTAKKHLPKVVALVFWSILVWWFYSYKAATGLSFIDMFVMLYEYLVTNPMGPFIYIVLYVVRPLIFFPATLLTALSGLLYGPVWGILYTVLGENASANGVYWFGRFFGKDWHATDGVFGHWVRQARHNPFMTSLIMRLVYLPFDATSFVSGAIKIKWSSFALATLVGILPGLSTFVLLGASLDINNLDFSMFKIDFKLLATSVTLFIGSLVLAKYVKTKHAHM